MRHHRSKLKRLLVVTLAFSLAVFGYAPPQIVRAAGELTVEVVTFDVIGYKHNGPSLGPGQYPVGVRICNPTAADANNVVTTFAFGAGGSTYFTLVGDASLQVGTLNAGTCAEVYYSVKVDTTKTASQLAANPSKTYSITAASAGSALTGTSGTRTLFLEALREQSSNEVYVITGPGGCNLDRSICDAPPTELSVGERYVFKLYAKTLTGGVDALEAFITFQGDVFRIVNVRSTYSVPAGVIGIGPFVDACGFVQPYLGGYSNRSQECPAGAQPGFETTGGQVGGTIVTTYTVDVIGSGSATLRGLIYHFGGTPQYNNDFLVNAKSRSVTAKYALTTTVTGDGLVTSSSGGLSCGTGGSTCSILVAATTPATSITLTATPSAGQSFTSWGGAGASCGTATTCSVSMTEAKNVSAAFTGASAYPLSVVVSGGGSVNSGEAGTKSISNCKDGSGDCSDSYVSGTIVNLSATPDSGFQFIGWGGACSGDSSTCTVSMSDAREVTAVFGAVNAATFPLTVAVTGPGKVTTSSEEISCGLSCTAEYAKDTTVTLTATANTGETFSGWGGACTGTTPTCTVSMSQSRYVSAAFSQKTLTVTFSGQGSGSVTSDPQGIVCVKPADDCSGTFDNNQEVTLTVAPADGSSLGGWGGSDGGACSDSSLSCTVTLSSDRTVDIEILGEIALSVTKVGGGNSQVTSSDSNISCGAGCASASRNYPEKASVVLSRGVDPGYRFVRWDGPCDEADLSGETCSVTMSESRSVTAQYATLRSLTAAVTQPSGAGHTISATAAAGSYSGQACSSGASGCTDFDEDTVVTLERSDANPGYRFKGWLNDGSSCSAASTTCEVTLSSAKSVTAQYVARRDLTVVVERPVGGTSTVERGAVDASESCSSGGSDCVTYDIDTPVTLSASAGELEEFVGWKNSDDTPVTGCSGTGPCTVTLDDSKSVKAIFQTRVVVDGKGLTIRKLTRGDLTNAGEVTSDADINCRNLCSSSSRSLNANTRVTLSVDPGSDYRFDAWSGVDCEGPSNSESTCTFVMTADQEVTAILVPLQALTRSITQPDGATYGITIDGGPTERSTCGVNCAKYDEDTVVTLTRDNPGDDHRFKGWGGACAAVDDAETTCTVTMDAAKDVTAEYGAVKKLTASVTGGGPSLTITPPDGAYEDECEDGAKVCKRFDEDTEIVIERGAPGDDHRFKGWGGACAAVDDAETTCTVTMDAAKDVTAEYGRIYKIAVTLTRDGKLTTDIDNWEGDSLECTATGLDTRGMCEVAYDDGDELTIEFTADDDGVERTRFREWLDESGNTYNCDNAEVIVDRVNGVCDFTVGEEVPEQVEVSSIVPLTVEIEEVNGGTGSVSSGFNWTLEERIECDPAAPEEGCQQYFDKDGELGAASQVTLIATPEVGSRFVRWEEFTPVGTDTLLFSGVTRVFSSRLSALSSIKTSALSGCGTASCTVTMSQAQYLRAVFEATSSGGGGGSLTETPSMAICSVDGTLPLLGSHMEDLIPTAAGASVSPSMTRAGAARRSFGELLDGGARTGVQRAVVGDSCATEIITSKGNLQFVESTYVGAGSASAYIWSEDTGWQRLAQSAGPGIASVSLPIIKFEKVGHYVIAITDGTGKAGTEGMWGTRSSLISVWITTPRFVVKFSPDSAQLSARAKRVLNRVMSEIALIPSEISVNVKGYVNPFIREYRRWQDVPLTVADRRTDRIYRYLLAKGLRIPVVPEDSTRGESPLKEPNRKGVIVINWGTGT